jgi:hypothetical protein
VYVRYRAVTGKREIKNNWHNNSVLQTVLVIEQDTEEAWPSDVLSKQSRIAIEMVSPVGQDKFNSNTLLKHLILISNPGVDIGCHRVLAELALDYATTW